MKKLLYYLLLVVIFLIGIFSGVAYVAQHYDLSSNQTFQYHIYNSLYYFLSLIVELWLLKYSAKRQKDFVLIGAMYGIASLIYDVILVQIIGGILLLTVILKIYFKLFPEDKFWQNERIRK
jgi:hypothetical protein